MTPDPNAVATDVMPSDTTDIEAIGFDDAQASLTDSYEVDA